MISYHPISTLANSPRFQNHALASPSTPWSTSPLPRLPPLHRLSLVRQELNPRSSLYKQVNFLVLKTELCRFSGDKIYPGKGIRFIRSDSQVFLFANSKCKRYFHNRLKPSKLTWTAMYRKQHKKDIAAESVKKKRRSTKKPYSRSIVGATLEVIQKRRTEKPEVRDAAREAALRVEVLDSWKDDFSGSICRFEQFDYLCDDEGSMAVPARGSVEKLWCDDEGSMAVVLESFP
ncbi:hypothetical protein EV2_045623 [Malus domestica]